MVEATIVIALLLVAAWVYSELRLGKAVRLALGFATVLVVAMAAAGVRELQYRHFTFRVTRAFEELSEAIRHGHGEQVHDPIQRFASAVRQDPSLAAAVDLEGELKKINAGSAPEDNEPLGEQDRSQ